MGKILFSMEMPEPKLRKKQAPPAKAHKDAKKYSRKCKHKAKREEAPGNTPGASFMCGVQGAGMPRVSGKTVRVFALPGYGQRTGGYSCMPCHGADVKCFRRVCV